MRATEHFCRGRWAPGPVVACPHHATVRGVPDLRPTSERNNVVTEGVASTGQVSTKGTVSHREWFDGHVDATARPRPVSMKLSDLPKRNS